MKLDLQWSNCYSENTDLQQILEDVTIEKCGSFSRVMELDAIIRWKG